MFTKQTKIAIVGVSFHQEKYGYKIFKDLIDSGYDVVGINPKGGELLGRKIITSLDELREVPELVMTVTQPAITEQIVEQAIQKGVKNIWMQPGSESEIAIQKAKQAGLQVTARACFMKNQHIW